MLFLVASLMTGSIANESVDILGGRGMFTTESAFNEDWKFAFNTTATQYTFEVTSASTSLNDTKSEGNEAESTSSEDEDSKMLKVKKKSIAKFDFDDGVYLKFENSKPRHLQFFCKTLNHDAESCDMRLYKAASKEAITN